MSQNKQNYLSVVFFSNHFTNIINIVRGIINLLLLTALKAFVFIMDSCDRSVIDYNNCQLWINVLNDVSFTIFCSFVVITCIFSVSKLMR